MPVYPLVDTDINEDCDKTLGTHYNKNCQKPADFELARIGTCGWVRESYRAAVVADVLNPAVWIKGIIAGDIIILALTNGSYDPGTPTQIPGYGRVAFYPGPRTQVTTIKDPVYLKNYPFYSSIQFQTDLVHFYLTSSILHIADAPAYIVPSDPVADDATGVVNWSITNTWISESPTAKFTITSLLSTIFNAKYINQLLSGYPAFTTQPTNVSIASGATLALTAVATGSPAPALQLQKSTDGGLTFADVTGNGANTGSYSKTGAVAGDAGKYRFKLVQTVNGVAGTPVYSDVVTVAVAAATTYANIIDFTSNASQDDGAGLTGAVSTANTHQKLKYTKKTTASGLSINVTIKNTAGTTLAQFTSDGRYTGDAMGYVGLDDVTYNFTWPTATGNVVPTGL